MENRSVTLISKITIEGAEGLPSQFQRYARRQDQRFSTFSKNPESVETYTFAESPSKLPS